jgi:hypothetical protein
MKIPILQTPQLRACEKISLSSRMNKKGKIEMIA